MLQSHTPSDPLFPNLNSLELPQITESFVSLVPFFLSPSITTIYLAFGSRVLSEVAAIASVITVIKILPTLCPNLQEINLSQLPRDPMITATVSRMLHVTNRNILQVFHVQSPLTKEASEVIYKLPNLRDLWVTVDGPSSLPTFVLPNLTTIDVEVECDDYHGWLQGFRGATLGKLASIDIRPRSFSIGDFLEAFECVALTTSIPETLSHFDFYYASRPWRPNYRSLLPFTQLKELRIVFSCGDYCPSTIDDYIITDLARALPKLEILHLGAAPCQTLAGVTVKGLAALAYHCLRLSRLRVHFQVTSLDPPVIPKVAPDTESTMLREDCALTDLEVGGIPVSEESALMIALTLLRIFPHLNFIAYSNRGWSKVAHAIRDSKKLADLSSKEPPIFYTSKIDGTSLRSRTWERHSIVTFPGRLHPWSR